ncbi:3 -5 exonuclease protein [Fusarium austroafricanum]|uniref:3 -5 exonuclease protein n=1 Tax=Fusarium austroafricanum TaxID=2364996 RepID=A0A8H4K5K2_9HYPO|nr:3 -5 exonuclease protein [Fusarium austroafricanum]
MKDHSLSQSMALAAQMDAPSTVSINSIPKLKGLLRELNGLPDKIPSIFIDVTGVGKNVLVELLLLIMPANTLYVINMERFDTSALSVVDGNETSLRNILESRTIKKVGFDIRGMSRLFHQMGVSLDGMWDIQLLELASRDYRESKKFLAGLDKCINQDIPCPNSAKARWLAAGHSANGQPFGAFKHVPRQRMQRVEIFPALWSTYRHRIHVPDNAFWLVAARTESWRRVQESKDSRRKHEEQHMGPTAWWDEEQLWEKMEVWNEELFLERRLGEYELNEDAEWVRTGLFVQY